jgi:hypothetical protein
MAMKRNPLEMEIDPEVLERTPLWFRKLREAYLRLKSKRQKSQLDHVCDL